MEPSLINVKEGDLILRKGDKLSELDLEKYMQFLSLTTDDRDLLPIRIYITVVTFLIAIFYISLILPDFWNDTLRSTIVAFAILINLSLSRFMLELGSTELFGENLLYLLDLYHTLYQWHLLQWLL